MINDGNFIRRSKRFISFQQKIKPSHSNEIYHYCASLFKDTKINIILLFSEQLRPKLEIIHGFFHN